MGDNDVDLGEIEYGKWQHWEIFVKEGYMQEHNPLMVVKRNGVERVARIHVTALCFALKLKLSTTYATPTLLHSYLLTTVVA